MTPLVRRRARELARAATLLEAGERLALRAAAGQATIARAPRTAQYLRQQARQEAAHARVFAGVAAFLAPAGGLAHPAGPLLAAYRARVDRDLDAGDLWSSMVGVQVALEALGRAVLEEVQASLARHLPVLAPLHRVLSGQEAAHHAFGVRCVRQALESGDFPAARLRAARGDYRVLAGGLLAASVEMLGESPAPYAARFEALLPAWFTDPS